MFGHFLILDMGGLIYNHFARVTIKVASSSLLLNGTIKEHASKCDFDSKFVRK